MLLGSHLSIAGGMDRAILSAEELGFDTLALFVRNQRQWRSSPLADEQVAIFRRERKRTGIGPVVAHGSYLVNLAGLADIRRKSIAAVKDDLNRCGRLGIEYLVLHPGSRAQTRRGIEFIAKGLNTAIAACPHRRLKILLETTAGQGNTIGRSFEQLAEILSLVDRPRRFGICLDTCHIFAAGYDITTPSSYERTMAEFDRILGLDNLLAIHLNDSAGELGSRRDRHAHVGAGKIGLRGLANFVTDPRLASIPMILETPKGLDDNGKNYDKINANKLRRISRTD